jgi:hypothetical protein
MNDIAYARIGPGHTGTATELRRTIIRLAILFRKRISMLVAGLISTPHACATAKHPSFDAPIVAVSPTSSS